MLLFLGWNRFAELKRALNRVFEFSKLLLPRWQAAVEEVAQEFKRNAKIIKVITP